MVRKQTLPAGASLQASLPGAGSATAALAVPRSAIVYHQGSAWLFTPGADDTFVRRLVTPGRDIPPDSIAIVGGLGPDEQVVVSGAEQLLASELQSGGATEP